MRTVLSLKSTIRLPLVCQYPAPGAEAAADRGIKKRDTRNENPSQRWPDDDRMHFTLLLLMVRLSEREHGKRRVIRYGVGGRKRHSVSAGMLAYLRTY